MKLSRNTTAIVSTILVLLAWSATVSEAAKGKQTKKPALVFMVAGQSNAGGCGIFSPTEQDRMPAWAVRKKIKLVPGSTSDEIGLPTDPSDYTHSYMWMPDKGFERFNPLVNTRPPARNTRVHGMELPVLNELEKRFPDNDIYVLKLGPSGKNLYHDWDPSRDDGFYAQYLDWYKKGMEQLVKEYPEVRVIGLYWDQGESDKPHADEYYDNLKNLIAAFRRDMGIPDLKFFIRKHIYQFRKVEIIAAAQKKVVNGDKNCYLLDIDLGDPQKNYETWSYTLNNLHLSSKGFKELAKRLFDEVLNDATVESFDLYTAK